MRPVAIGTAITALTAAFAGSAAAAAPPTTTTPTGTICPTVPDGAALVVTDASGVAIERAGGTERLSLPTFAAAPTRAVRGPDGTVWVQVPSAQTETVTTTIAQDAGDGVPMDVFRVNSGASEAVSVAAGGVTLMSAGWLDGRTAATIVDFVGARDDEETYGSVLVDFADGEQRDVGPAGGIEYGVNSVTIGAGRIVEGAFADLSEAFSSSDPAGTRLEDWASPITSEEYNQPPLHIWPAAGIAPGSTEPLLSWVEAPDWNAESEQIEGGWSVVVADAVTGTETMRLDLGDPGDWLIDADFDGRFWVGTFADDPEPPDPDRAPVDQPPARVLVVDTTASGPAVADAGCAAGVTATLDRNGTPAPPPPTTAAPTTAAPTTAAPTTAAPTTAAPTTEARCTYVEADNAYPLRKCDKGPAVSAIQEQINKRGQSVDVDGYFGPGTEQAVRNFQQAAGLEVDGLVGPDTWAALYTGDPAGADSDGNGTVDPWEVSAAAPPPGVPEAWIGSTYPYPQFDSSGEGGSAGTAELDGVTVWAAWGVEADGSPAPYYRAIWLIPSNDTRTLVFGRTETDPRDDPNATVTIVDAVDVPHQEGLVPAFDCALDGAVDPSVVAAVTVDYSVTPVSFPVHAAWRLDAAGETIQPLDVARVSCADGVPIVD